MKSIKRKVAGRNTKQSLSKKLLREKKITPQFKRMLSTLTLEDLITLKLETAAENVRGKLYGFPIMSNTSYIIKESLINFALSATVSHKEAANMLGLSISELKRFIRRFNINKNLDS